MTYTVFTYSLVVIGVAFLMSLFTILLRRKFVNQDQFSEWQQTVKQWQADKNIAKKTDDKKLTAKLRKQEKRINQIQSKMAKGQMITMVIQMAFFFVVWQILMIYLGDKIVAYLPFQIPFVTDTYPYPLPFFYWYMICSFLSSIILQRIFGVSMGMGMQPSSST